MANHSYVNMKKALTFEEGQALLRKVVAMIWGERVAVSHRPDSTMTDYHVWAVHAPGTIPADYRDSMKASNEDFGFTVWLSRDGHMWEFRHPFNGWEHWAQDKVQHTLARVLGITWYTDDGTLPDREKVDPDALKDTYRAFLRRNYKDEELDEGTQAFHEHLLSMAPEGFRE